MLNRLCLEEDVPLVNIVRKPEQEELLRAAGAEHVCNSASPSFMNDLTQAINATSATLAFDAIGGGKLASQILTCMEAAASATESGYSRYGSTAHKQLYIYGGLDRSPTILTRNFGMAWGTVDGFSPPSCNESAPTTPIASGGGSRPTSRPPLPATTPTACRSPAPSNSTPSPPTPNKPQARSIS
jgi:hypothetical protein